MSKYTYHEIKIKFHDPSTTDLHNFINFISRLCLLDIHKDKSFHKEVTYNLNNLYIIYQLFSDYREAIYETTGSIVNIDVEEFINRKDKAIKELVKDMYLRLFVIHYPNEKNHSFEYYRLFIDSVNSNTSIEVREINKNVIDKYRVGLIDWYRKYSLTYKPLVDGTDISIFSEIKNFFKEKKKDNKAITEAIHLLESEGYIITYNDKKGE